MIIFTKNGQINIGINCTGNAVLMKCWDNDSSDDPHCQTNTLLSPKGARALANELKKSADDLENQYLYNKESDSQK